MSTRTVARITDARHAQVGQKCEYRNSQSRIDLRCIIDLRWIIFFRDPEIPMTEIAMTHPHRSPTTHATSLQSHHRSSQV